MEPCGAVWRHRHLRHFNGQTDMVESGHVWTRNPFGGAVEGDRIHGRGACDMKGGLAASIIAAKAFRVVIHSTGALSRSSATADEESGGYGGVACPAEHGCFAPNGGGDRAGAGAGAKV